LGKQLSLDDRLQLCPGAVLDHAGKDFAAASAAVRPHKTSSITP
jgi:hypothetical protein